MESELGLIMDGLPALVWTATPDGRIDFANRRWFEYTGLDPAEAGGSDLSAAICREDLPQSLERWRAILTSGEPGDLEARLRRFDARCRRFLIRCSPARDKAGRIVKWSFVGTDIEDLRRPQKGPEEAGEAPVSVREAGHSSKQRRGTGKLDPRGGLRRHELATANEELEKEIEELREVSAALRSRRDQFLQSIPGLLFGFTPSGEIQYINQKALDYLGWTPPGLKDWVSGTPIHPEDRPGAIELFTQSIASCESFEVELRLRRFDGAYRWFEARGFPLQDASGSLLVDIDDRKRAEDALHRSEAALRREHQHLVTAQRLSHTGSFTSSVSTDEHIWSDELYRILERDPGTKISFQPFRESIHPEDLKSFNAALARSIADGVDFDQVFRVVTPSGNVKHLHTVAHCTEDMSGRPVFMGAIQDVTESKVAAEALATSERNLRLVINTIPGLAATTRADGYLDFINQPRNGSWPM